MCIACVLHVNLYLLVGMRMYWEGIFFVCRFRFALGDLHVYHVYIGYLTACVSFCVLRSVAMCIPRNVLMHAYWDIEVCFCMCIGLCVTACVRTALSYCICICIWKRYEKKF